MPAYDRPSVRTVLVVCPQERDRQLIDAAGLDRAYRVRYVGEDLDKLERFDAQALLEACLEGPAAAVPAAVLREAGGRTPLAARAARRRSLAAPAGGGRLRRGLRRSRGAC